MVALGSGHITQLNSTRLNSRELNSQDFVVVLALLQFASRPCVHVCYLGRMVFWAVHLLSIVRHQFHWHRFLRINVGSLEIGRRLLVRYSDAEFE